MTQARFAQPAPTEAEVYCDGHLKIARYEDVRDRPCVKAWRKKSQKPFACHWFRSVEQRNQWIEYQIDATTKRREAQQRHAEQRKADAAAMRDQIEVGTLLAYSFGCSMTLVEFFQVVEKRGAMVTIRQIESEATGPEDRGGSQRVRPAPDRFIGPPKLKRITAYGVSIDNGSARPTTADATHYVNHYD